uniref:Putative secreted protein n=1 Tax=Ixodes ricinus TaxID=34613 RepID=A0A6B0UNQ2_IXORI
MLALLSHPLQFLLSFLLLFLKSNYAFQLSVFLLKLLLEEGVALGEVIHLLLLVPHGLLGEAYPLPEGLLLLLQHLPDPLLGLPRPPLPQQLKLLLRGQLVLGEVQQFLPQSAGSRRGLVVS